MSIDEVKRTVVTQEPVVDPAVPEVATQEPAAVAQEAAVVAEPVVVAREPVPIASQPIRPAVVAQETVRTDSRHVTRSPGGSEMTRRVIVLVFGLIQIVIGLRIVLLLLNAREANALVSGILDVSQIFVAPFEGILRTNALTSGGSMLDVAAVVAFVGWTILELIVLWAVGIFRREPV